MASHNFINLTGQTFGRLVVLERANNAKGQHTQWKCLCACGNIVIVSSANLKVGNTKSCGCLRKEVSSQKSFVHGMHKSPEYRTWERMKERCCNTNRPAYKYYGGRGISIYPKWKDSFIAFFNYIGPKPPGNYSIDRINTNGNYEPGNVRWATPKEQANNSRRNHLITINAHTLNIQQWADFVGIKPLIICTRIHRGWPPEKAIFTPVKHQRSSLL